MIAEIVKVNCNGHPKYLRIPIPQSVREELKWEVGTRVLVTINGKNEMIVRNIEDVNFK